MSKTAAHDSLRIAAIDVGSNSVHMIVAQVDGDGGVTTLWRMKEMVGLGRISFPAKVLSPEAMDRAVASLNRMKQAAQQRQCEKIVAVATSAIREAANGGELIERIRNELRLHVRVVSAREEARLIYLGVRGALDLGKKPHLMIDIGGGSVEFIVGDATDAVLLESRKLGAARMSAQFIKSDPISTAELAALHKHYDAELTSLAEKILPLKPIKCLGTSGTLENIADLCGDVDKAGDRSRVIERAKLEKLEAKLIKSSSADRARLRGLDDQRKDQIVAGVTLVGQFMRTMNLDQIELCGAALREGILNDYLARHVPDMQVRRTVPDPRRREVLDLARRALWNEPHSTHVAKLTLKLFDDLRPLHALGDHARELIEYAAMLHDIGWHIGADDHHKHSEYLIEHGRLRAFAENEIAIIAQIARFHRKRAPDKKRHKRFAALGGQDRRIVEVGASLLRIADSLDRSHAAGVQGVRCRIDQGRVTVVVTANADIQLELWAARKKREMFEQVFDKSIDFERK